MRENRPPTLVTVAGLMEIGAAGSTASSFIPSLKLWAAMVGCSWKTNTQTRAHARTQELLVWLTALFSSLHNDQTWRKRRRRRWRGAEDRGWRHLAVELSSQSFILREIADPLPHFLPLRLRPQGQQVWGRKKKQTTNQLLQRLITFHCCGKINQ